MCHIRRDQDWLEFRIADHVDRMGGDDLQVTSGRTEQGRQELVGDPPRTCSVGEESVPPAVGRDVEGAGGRQERQQVPERGHGDGGHERLGERLPWPVHLAGHGADAVPVVEVPEQRVEEELPVPLPGHDAPPPRPDLGQRGARHDKERRERRDAEPDGGPPHDGEPRAVDGREEDVEGDDGGGARRPPRHGGRDARQVVGAQRRERGAVDGGGDVLPRAHERARQRAEGAVGPQHVAAVARDGGGELRGDQRLRDGPDEGEDEEAQQRVQRARRLHRGLRAVGTPRDLEEDEEDERHQGQLAPAAGPGSFMAAASVRQGVSGGVLVLGVPLDSDSDSEMGVASSHAVADREARRGGSRAAGGAVRGKSATNREGDELKRLRAGLPSSPLPKTAGAQSCVMPSSDSVRLVPLRLQAFYWRKSCFSRQSLPQRLVRQSTTDGADIGGPL